jgi:hypothetical protein
MTDSQPTPEQSGFNPAKIIPAKDYLREHPQPVILHFQPTGFIRVETPDELQRWEAMVRDLVGLSVSVGQGTGTATICDLSAGAIEDDCDKE